MTEAPKGRQMIARGNALGMPSHDNFLPLLLVPVWKDQEERAGLVAPELLSDGGERRAFPRKILKTTPPA
jgi:hypothetical protein